MAFRDKPKRHWIIPQECLSPEDLVLGSILKYPDDPIDILNRKEVEPIDPSALVSEREQVTKSFTDALDTGFGSKIGASSVLAAVLGASPFIEGNWSKSISFTIEAKNVRAQRFIPSVAYVNKAMRTEQVDSFVRNSLFSAPIYMVVGITIAKTVSRTAERSHDRGGGGGMGIGPPGTGIEVSGELTANHGVQSTYHDLVEDEVVLAYRLRRFRYSKRKDEFRRAKQDETKHTRYTVEKLLRSKVDVEEDDDDTYVPTFSYFEGDDVVASDVEMAGFTEGTDDQDSDDAY
ncbi:hypothetical protein FPOAC2_06982 [Fusarium poae]|uniref:hypothetical protein n=1 Tax=Fusarium poae TaxID=36050 RepID=UPI001CE73E0C|nr:hypothetical protein FPOAC1_006850 [Fusarium poae]KAG8673536.1 hypothetical protein FPOAC1_006850 [Fusarium poae]